MKTDPSGSVSFLRARDVDEFKLWDQVEEFEIWDQKDQPTIH